MIEPIELTTERLLLTTLEPADAERVLSYLVRNRAFQQEWSPRADDAFYTVAAQAERLAREQDRRHQGLGLRFHLFKRSDPARATVIGDLALSNIVRGAFQSCHLGYHMDERELNRGYITEALRRVIAYAFDELRLHRIEANIMPRNARSIRVVEKLGFSPEGLARKYLKINGVWEDHIHFVLLNDEIE